ncbi:hypothetical protein HPB48_005352 [Haemaphysalis longicornis]|uniref:Uncharacterized protein n=1 Tax=Haemaphysalis longicornis TaxID=44386 RepID=A0A9J6GFV8_HAELO|nr:hypothetical protein HPB48_005352 [Haemaphysalis longicornis]
MATRLVPEEDGWMKVLRKGQVPANQTTLILQPQEDFTLADFRPAALMIAIRDAGNLLPSEANATYITIHQHQNIAVIKTLQKTAAAKITRTSSICIHCKPSQESMRLRDAPGGLLQRSCSWHRCRHPDQRADGQPLCPGDRHHQRPHDGKIGNSITFRGTYIPPYILFYMAKYRCKPNKPKAQFCNTCYCIGHRADVCPQAGSHKCKKCGKLLDEPDQQHECHMNCVNCHGEHPADYEDCPARREADAETTKAAYLKRIKLRKNQQEQLTQKQVQVQDPKTHEQQPKSQPLQRNHASRVSRPNQRDARQGRSNSCNSTPGTRRSRSLSAGRRNTEVSRPAFLPFTPTRHTDKHTHRNEHKPIWQSQSYKQALVRKKKRFRQ